MKLRLSSVFILIIIISLYGAPQALSTGFKKTYSISGQTMGTFYNVVIYTHKTIKPSDLKQKIDVQLKRINQQMSLYLKMSEISKFNRAKKNESIHISIDFYRVITEAQKLYRITDGAWDGTVRPLYDLWNFDATTKNVSKIPGQTTIELYLGRIGFENIIIADKMLTKKNSGLTLDLGSIAKGYGVDSVVTLLKKSNFKNYFVEIGGEVYVAGQKSGHKKWKIGISMPKHGYNDKPYKILNLYDKALATSGTYRNFFELNEKTYSHVINPKTGWPVDNNIVSVSVVADNCMFADGLATGLMIMGRQKGIELVNKLDNVECLIVVKKNDNSLKPVFSADFEKYIAN